MDKLFQAIVYGEYLSAPKTLLAADSLDELLQKFAWFVKAYSLEASQIKDGTVRKNDDEIGVIASDGRYRAN